MYVSTLRNSKQELLSIKKREKVHLWCLRLLLVKKSMLTLKWLPFGKIFLLLSRAFQPIPGLSSMRKGRSCCYCDVWSCGNLSHDQSCCCLMHVIRELKMTGNLYPSSWFISGFSLLMFWNKTSHIFSDQNFWHHILELLRLFYKTRYLPGNILIFVIS